MKQILLIISVAMGIATTGKAQCNQTIELISTKTNVLSASNQSQGTRTENVIIDITPTTVTVKPNGNADDALIGKIIEVQCDWKIPFKEGKTVIKTDLVDASGDTKDATITIEGKNGKITLLAEAKERPDQKMQFEITKFGPEAATKK